MSGTRVFGFLLLIPLAIWLVLAFLAPQRWVLSFGSADKGDPIMISVSLLFFFGIYLLRGNKK